MTVNSEQFIIDFLINSNLSKFGAEVAAARGQLKQLELQQQSFYTTQSALAKGQAVLNAELSKSFQSSKVLGAEAPITRFGNALEKGKLKVRDMKSALSEYRNELTRTTGQISRLATEEVRRNQSMVVSGRPVTKASIASHASTAGTFMGTNYTMPQADMSTAIAQSMKLNKERQIAEVLQHKINVETINWGKNMQWSGRQIMVGFTMPIAILGGVATATFISMNKELTRLQKVYGSITLSGKALDDQNKKVAQQGMGVATEMANKYGQSGKETLSLMADIAAAGKEGNDLAIATKETTRLMVLGEVDKQKAFETTLSLQNAFKISSQELAGSIDFLNAVENQTSLSLDDMTTAIPKAGTVVKSLGGDVKDLSLFMTALKEGGVGAAEGANALKTGLARIISPTAAAKKSLGAFGINLDTIVSDNKGNIKNMVFALQDAIEKNVPQTDKAQVFEKLFGKWQFAKMLAMFDNLRAAGSQTNEVMRLMGASSSELAQIAANEIKTTTESASQRWKIMFESMKIDLAKIGERVLAVLIPIGEFIGRVFGGFNKLNPAIQTVALIAAGVAAMVGPLVMLIGLGANFFGNIKQFVLWTKTWATQQRGVTKEFVNTTDQMRVSQELEKLVAIETRKEADNMRIVAEAQAKAMGAAAKRSKLAVLLNDLEGNSNAISRNKMSLEEKIAALEAKSITQAKKMVGLKGEELQKAAKKQAYMIAELEGLNKQASILKEINIAKETGSVLNTKQQQSMANQVRTQGITAPLAYQTHDLNINGKVKNYGLAIDQRTKELIAATDAEGRLIPVTGQLSMAEKRMAEALTLASKGEIARAEAVMQTTKRERLGRGINSNMGRMGIGMGAMMGASMIPSSVPGSDAIQNSVQGAGAGMMVGGGWGMAAGAAIGGTITLIQKLQKQIDDKQRKIVSSFDSGSFAVKQFGIELKTSADVGMSSFEAASKQAITEVNALKDAINSQDVGGVEKNLVESIKGASEEDAVKQGFNYYLKQIANGVPKDKVKSMLAAIFSDAGRNMVFDTKLKVKIDGIKIDKDQARKELISQIGTMNLQDIPRPNYAGGAYSGGGGSGAGGMAGTETTTKEYMKLANVLATIPFNTTIDKWKEMNNALKQNGVDLSSNNVKYGAVTEALTKMGQTDLVSKLGELKDQGYSLNSSFAILNASSNGLSLNFTDLNAHASDTPYILYQISLAAKQAAANTNAYNGVIKAIRQEVSKGDMKASAASKAQAEHRSKALQDEATKAQEISDKQITSMQDRFKNQEEAMQKNIDAVGKQYDKEIAHIQKLEDARQKAFEAEQKRIQRANELRNMHIDYLKAVNTGDYFGALTIKGNIATKKKDYALQDKDQGKSDKAQEKIDNLNAQKDRVVGRMQARLDATKKANEAAVKGAQDRAKAEQDSYKKQEEAAQKTADKASKIAKKTDNQQKWLTERFKKHWEETGHNITKALELTKVDAERNGLKTGNLFARGMKLALKNHLLLFQIQPGTSRASAESISKLGFATAYALAQNTAEASNKRRGRAIGGAVYGAGTSTSDSIPIMASNGEFIMRAASVSKYGTSFMNRLNSGMLNASDIARFSDGGAVYNAYSYGGSVRNNAPVASNTTSGYSVINVHFGRTSASAKQIEDVLCRVVDKQNSKVGNR